MALSEADRIRMLEGLAADESLKATQRLRALEELGRIEARKAGAGSGQQGTQDPEEMAPDPMADLYEDELARQRRLRGTRAA